MIVHRGILSNWPTASELLKRELHISVHSYSDSVTFSLITLSLMGIICCAKQGPLGQTISLYQLGAQSARSGCQLHCCTPFVIVICFTGGILVRRKTFPALYKNTSCNLPPPPWGYQKAP